ncbi:MAG: helix-turn-helix transcriptional regulator [Ottowia sp.]|uniref:substrate-binding domain-containing protein n=1 Tax=Ottowia sp. TaxID=1898956 RepID=UPI001B61F990|nr:substrate-binding domain-containing protein [Ottowia sp.]MBP7457666.1 helix-turn-helix transcriptional regulator [Ottowia sp.]MBP9523253.1 helix-turn-helix transcriptional regulator [Ottowia sp.]MBP9670931.1 helix-turn-helix transcriptional regulator [Ottowia sp.]HPU09246.1 substrate-binding domain-containing protein [Ottowia sp.]HRM54824.1 substrate-binding domain-containing protein [Ottowia sp.]
MQKIGLSYSLGTDGGGPLIRNPLLDLLQAVRSSGSISSAASALGLSYRHVWGELRRWEQELGQPLLHWEKGRRARLSEFGDKLLWSERQAQARLAPQIEALRAELERTFAVAFDDAAHVLTLYASHDDALVALRQHAASLPGTPRLHLDIRFTGSVDAIAALNEGRCIMAGFHTLRTPAADSLAARTYKPLLQPGLHKLIGFATRTQGLMVRPGNPHRIQGLADLNKAGVRFVNRALGTGTRVLLDELLAAEDLAAADVRGYHDVEPSHAAVAQAVAAGGADAGLGIEAAARARGLDFVPLIAEDYHLVCLKEALDEAPVAALRALLASPGWAHELNALPGYQASHAGEVRSMASVLPWWQFKQPKRRAGMPARR